MSGSFFPLRNPTNVPFSPPSSHTHSSCMDGEVLFTWITSLPLLFDPEAFGNLLVTASGPDRVAGHMRCFSGRASVDESISGSPWNLSPMRRLSDSLDLHRISPPCL